jgi:pimeloyl-ACP methyl ester carboxylesterase
MANHFSHNPRERLSRIYDFSSATLDVVDRLAKKQSEYKTFQEYFKDVGIGDAKTFKLDANHGVSVVDVMPAKHSRTIVVHLPMNNPLDSNQKYQIAMISSLMPSARVIAFGNPSGGKYAYKHHNLYWWERLGIATGLQKKPLVKAELACLESLGVNKAYHIGYSYGATKAMIAAKCAPQGSVEGVLSIERVSHAWTPITLAKRFYAAFKPLEEYARRTSIPTYIDARRKAGDGNDFYSGLRRSINLSIGWMLAFTSGARLARNFMVKQPRSEVVLAWGTESELVDDKRMQREVNNLMKMFSGRVRFYRLEGQQHALSNDIHLHAAIIYEALNKQH